MIATLIVCVWGAANAPDTQIDATAASPASGSRSFQLRRFFMCSLPCFIDPCLVVTTKRTVRCNQDPLSRSARLRSSLAGNGGGIRGSAAAPSQGTPEAVPNPPEPVRRDDDDDQEDQADDRVEAAADHGQLDVADIVVDDDEGESADPGSLDPGEAADDGHHEQLDRGSQPDVARCDLPLPPDEQDSRQGGDERGEAERERPVQRHVETERAHPDGVVSHTLEREPERCPDQVPDRS